MAKSYHVFSTLANDQRYINYTKGGNETPIPEREVYIKGGAGMANDRLITPLGVMTTVSEEDVATLKANHVFQLHEKNGHVVIRERSADPEKVAADMNRMDKSAPITPSHYENSDDAKPRE